MANLNVLKDKLGKILNPIIPRYSYKIGDLFLTTNTENPNKRFGGTWELVAKGRTLVGVDENDSDFKSVKKTGGEKTHKLTIDEMPSHTHHHNVYAQSSWNQLGASCPKGCGNTADWGNETEKTGGDKAHNNMPPYFTCYIWIKLTN